MDVRFLECQQNRGKEKKEGGGSNWINYFYGEKKKGGGKRDSLSFIVSKRGLEKKGITTCLTLGQKGKRGGCAQCPILGLFTMLPASREGR